MTIHDMADTIKNNIFANINESKLNELYQEISQKMNNLIGTIKNMNNSQLIEITDINYTYTSDILPYIYNKEKEDLNEEDFFLYI